MSVGLVVLVLIVVCVAGLVLNSVDVVYVCLLL